MRTYTDDMLKDKSRVELVSMLENVKTSDVLTIEEKKANIEILETKINGVNSRNDAILKDIAAGAADIDDIGGY